jgi:hypothetical protein
MAARFGSGMVSLKRWFSSSPSRAELVAAVDNRRAQILAAQLRDAPTDTGDTPPGLNQG